MTPRQSPGPFMLRLVGRYGFGKRSVIDINHVEVIDLGAPPDDDAPVTPGAGETTSRTFLSEDASPEIGLNFTFGDQHFSCDAAGNWREAP